MGVADTSETYSIMETTENFEDGASRFLSNKLNVLLAWR
jgi:hypothetical protein